MRLAAIVVFVVVAAVVAFLLVENILEAARVCVELARKTMSYDLEGGVWWGEGEGGGKPTQAAGAQRAGRDFSLIKLSFLVARRRG